MLILFYILSCIIPITQAKVLIKYGSVAPINPGDVGMIFYFTLVNRDECRYSIYVEMDKCCEKLGNNEIDCDVMQLLGGSMGTLYPHSTKNITMLYPNMYLLNRRGKCVISVFSTNEQGRNFKASHSINFNTAKTAAETFGELEICDKPDLDPLDDCQPVNCEMKYLGCRNYFDQKHFYCTRIPHCYSDPNNELPDVVYIPLSNRCRDLRQTISKTDLKHLEQGVMVGKTWEKMGNFPVVSANFRCHHGKIDNKTGFCVCNEGWSSVSFTKHYYEPTLALYHMCNIRVGSWHEMNEEKFKMTMLVIALIAVTTTIFILFTTFCLNLLYHCLRALDFRDGGTCNFVADNDDDVNCKWASKTIIRTTRRPTCCPESCLIATE